MSNLKQEVIDFVEADNTYLEFYGDSEDSIITFETRQNGDVGEKIHSNIDYQEALSLERRLIHNFGEKIDTDIETVDEWVHLQVEIV